MTDAADFPEVTVIVPLYNERSHIRDCLASLLAQDYPADKVEILVVDGMSGDGSREAVTAVASEAACRIRLLDNPRRVPAAALNTAIRQARGQVILRLDAHARAAPDFIRQSVGALARSGADCVGGPIESQARGFTGRAIALAMSSPFGVGNALFRYAQSEQYVDTVAFGGYPRRIFDRIGLYDEDLVYSEDNELNDRLRKHGGRILLTPAIRTIYYTRESLRALWGQYFHYGYGRARLMIRNPSSIRLRHVVPFAFVTVLGLAAVMALLALLGLGPVPRGAPGAGPGSAASAVGTVFSWLLVCVAAAYLIASLSISLRIAAKQGLRYFPILPVAFACQHLGYGLGTWAGLLASLRPLLPLRRRSRPGR